MRQSCPTPRARFLRAALALAGLATLGACAPVHPRVWQNGEWLTSSRAYSNAMSGDHSFKTQRDLYSSASPLRMYSRDVPFPYFGHW
jgi:hypothetical protein